VPVNASPKVQTPRSFLKFTIWFISTLRNAQRPPVEMGCSTQTTPRRNLLTSGTRKFVPCRAIFSALFIFKTTCCDLQPHLPSLVLRDPESFRSSKNLVPSSVNSVASESRSIGVKSASTITQLPTYSIPAGFLPGFCRVSCRVSAGFPAGLNPCGSNVLPGCRVFWRMGGCAAD
jgi:hypothetical protein